MSEVNVLVVASISNPRAAQAFVDYMKTLGVGLQLQFETGSQVSILATDQDYHQAVAEFELFQRDPSNSKYLAASWQTGQLDSGLKATHSGPSLWRKFIGGAGWLTLSVIALCVVVYLLGSYSNLYFFLFFPPSHLWADGEIWRWLTPAFIHFSLFHIAFNLGWWWLLGGQIERRFSAGFLFNLLFLSAIMSNFCQYIFSGSIHFGGLSGVVYALFGYCWLFGKLRPDDVIKLTNSMFTFVLVWLLIGFVDLLPIAFANAAHLSGLFVGMAFAFGHHKLSQ